jgi:hypothetical protein
MANLMDRCKNCGKPRGEHNATTKACPTGRKSRVGYITYSPDRVFEEGR